MTSRPFHVDWLAEDTSDTLKTAYLSEHVARLRTRLHGLWLLRTGRRLGDVASIVGGSLSDGGDLGRLVQRRRRG